MPWENEDPSVPIRRGTVGFPWEDSQTWVQLGEKVHVGDKAAQSADSYGFRRGGHQPRLSVPPVGDVGGPWPNT